MFDSIPVSTTSTDSYTITVGENLMEEVAETLASRFSRSKLFMIIDEKVYRNHSSYIESELEMKFSRITKYVVPSGESNKSMEQFSRIVDFILENGVERSTSLLAVGGGVVGDLAGFVAASVLRGIPLIHLPTTLLAMVDSSIGGKTGVNHEVGKNLIGAFYQPKAVFADVTFLETLPRQEWVNGMSEILKYAMIESPDLFTQLKELTQHNEFASPKEWIPIIKQSADIKVDIVNKDVKESGIREFLNFGHTFAHVIERKGEYGHCSHGEAVFAGMFGAVEASNRTGASISTNDLEYFKPLYNLNLEKIGTDTKELTQLMLRDKKVKDQTIRLILLEEMGKPVVKSFEETKLVEASWNYLISEFT
ncbi:MAG: 3-dehydroquinate synthase [Balneolaceae bacterium]|nr:3-dehydroquinate synthase [Balneolaceae bacterium]MBO6547384.1 3-dehydroquinate synthase [Balneolaceae bacterium]MBO6647669.1 3-dehydroquinate synthase [Balneolaceae bacterium]